MLPLAEGTRVALVGDFAKVPRYQGAGSSLVNCTRLDTLLGSVEASGLTCVGYEPGFPRAGGLDERMASAAVDLASAADVTLCCLGLSEAAESEGLDRPNMALDEGQVALLERLATANDNVVVLLFAGGAVETGWSRHARAVLYLGLGGQAGASAALDVVTGRVNPAGRLAETWPRALSDVPCADAFPADGPTAEYREAIYVGYRYYQTAGVPVAYPFGHGLSYTRFAYSDLDVEQNGAAVSFTLTNVGPRAGAEVAQVYVSKPDARVFLPERELKGFARLTLAAGESRRVRVPLDDKAFRYFNVRTSAWEVEGGTYVVSVGGSSEDLPLSARVAVRGTLAPDPYGGEELPSYRSGSVRDVGPKEFAALLRRPLPRPGVALDRNLCLRDVGRGRSPLFWAVGAVLKRAATRLDADGRPNLGALFIYNMPLRALAKNAGEYVSMGLVDAIVREIRGWGLAGIAVAVVFRIVLGWSAPLVWFLWFALPLAWEFALNLVLNAVGRARLERESAARTPRGHTSDARTSRGQEAETKK
jgi:beta-glucosidase